MANRVAGFPPHQCILFSIILLQWTGLLYRRGALLSMGVLII